MPHAHIVLESPIRPTFRTSQVAGMFDVPPTETVRHEWDVDVPIEGRPWSLGLIVGPSGSGKTTIGRRLFPEALFHAGYDWPAESAIVDGFPSHLDGKAITQSLSSVGFSSPPHWLKRFAHLSNGQKFRCELARVLLEDAESVVFDEFTSVVDRDAARVSAAAVAKALRRRGRPRLVALSCHYDVIDWLDPDWVYDTASFTFAWRDLRGRPPLELRIHPAPAAAWSLFRGHHYLSRDLNRSAHCFVATWHDQPVGFASYLHFFHGTVKNAKREHRTVVLPDFQGVGIGNALSTWLGGHVRALGFRFLSTTSHPAMIRHRACHPAWKLTSFGHKFGGGDHANLAMKRTRSVNRFTASFEYVGPPLPLTPVPVAG